VWNVWNWEDVSLRFKAAVKLDVKLKGAAR